MKRVTLALATLLVALAVVSAADARVVQPPGLSCAGTTSVTARFGAMTSAARGVLAGARWHSPTPIRRPTERCRGSLPADGAASAITGARASTPISPGSAGRNFLQSRSSRCAGGRDHEMAVVGYSRANGGLASLPKRQRTSPLSCRSRSCLLAIGGKISHRSRCFVPCSTRSTGTTAS